jgi:uncharacterized protein YdeI (YjbR/CyaY-like superfamily)
MAVVPRPEKTLAFENAPAFERWLSRHHAQETELWLKIHKQASGLATVTYAAALEVALCWGWIDGVKMSLDADSFLQRFTPRKPKSRWSQINCKHAERLIAAGRMRPPGQRLIDEAKTDGRWDAAYAGQRAMELPLDLVTAIEAVPKARALLATLNRQNLYALGYRVQNLKTPAARARKIEAFVAMLARGETLYPNEPHAKRGAVGPKTGKAPDATSAKVKRPKKKKKQPNTAPSTLTHKP